MKAINSIYFFSILFFCLSLNSIIADELIVIQAVSSSKKKFITRNGKDKGISPGMSGTFITDDFSIIAVAKIVNRDLTLWQVKKKGALVPFKKGDYVTYSEAPEKVWALTKESLKENIDKNLQTYFMAEKNKIDQELEYYNLYSSKQVEKIKLESNKDAIDKDLKNYFTTKKLEQDSTYIRKQIEIKKIINEVDPTHSFSLMLHYNQGISEQVSSIDPAGQSSNRFGYQVNLKYQYRLVWNLFLEGGVRLDQEENVYNQFVMVTNRQYLTLGANYFFSLPNREKPWCMYMGLQAELVDQKQN
ncbi:MAG: hypothetical protein U0T83_03340 [Bacteriovoracaceae bacterium]